MSKHNYDVSEFDVLVYEDDTDGNAVWIGDNDEVVLSNKHCSHCSGFTIMDRDEAIAAARAILKHFNCWSDTDLKG